MLVRRRGAEVRDEVAIAGREVDGLGTNVRLRGRHRAH